MAWPGALTASAIVPNSPNVLTAMERANRIQIALGDITQLDVDAVVTAANQALCGGGGVDGAVHRAAGPNLVLAGRELAPCPPGQAVITAGFDLPARYVIHAVGPVFANLENDGPVLASAYRSSLTLARDNQVQRIAFPCISTGVYGFPRQPACDIAIHSVLDWLNRTQLPHTVVFCVFSPADQVLYRTCLDDLGVDFSELAD